MVQGLVLGFVLIAGSSARAPTGNQLDELAPPEPIAVPRLVFVAPPGPPGGGGGGGGGNRQKAPVRHALGPGHDPATFPVAPPAVPRAAVPDLSVEDMPIPLLTLDARPLSGGNGDQIGLPVGGVSSGTSTGPGSGGGVGTGAGTGIGSGRGAGIGPGSGGGMGGGAYKPGGAVSAPLLLSRVTPGYTPEALRDRIQGTVWLEVVVTHEGRPSEIRVVRSLDAGLDQEAVRALGQWRFEPGRLAGRPVDVLVSVAMDFWIR